MNLLLSLCLGVVFSRTFAEKTHDEDTLSNILTELKNLQEAQKTYTNTLDEFKSRVFSLENTVKDLQRENKELVSEIRRLKNDKRQNVDINDDQLKTDEPVEERVSNVDDSDKNLNATFPMLKTVKEDKKMKKHVRNTRQVADTNTAFSAGLSGDITLGDYHTVIYDWVITNIGNAYHPHTGIFIAPCRGLYVFSTTMMVSPGKRLYLEIVKDGSPVNDIYADSTSANDYISTTKEWTLEVNKGSEVWIRSISQEKTHDEDTLSNILTELRNLQEAQKTYTNALDEFKSRVLSLENTVKDLQRENKELVSEIRRLKNDKRQNVDINDDQVNSDEPVEKRDPNVDDSDKMLNATYSMLKTVKEDKKTKEHVRNIRQVADTHTAFTAGLSVGDITLGDHHTVIYDRVYTNIGNAYHAHTGIFIAPCRGLYFFSTTMMVSPGKDLYLEIVKDGNRVNYIYADSTSANDYISTTKEWTLEVNKGSEVWIRSSSQGQLHGGLHSLFSGFLLFETE